MYLLQQLNNFERFESTAIKSDNGTGQEGKMKAQTKMNSLKVGI